MTLEDLFALRDDLPLAPVYARQDTDLARAIDSRRFATGRTCASCRAEASPVLYMNASDLLGLPRWLDLCWPCYSSLVSMVLHLGLDDAEIIERWEAWHVTQGLGGLAAEDAPRHHLGALPGAVLGFRHVQQPVPRAAPLVADLVAVLVGRDGEMAAFPPFADGGGFDSCVPGGFGGGQQRVHVETGQGGASPDMKNTPGLVQGCVRA